jgi:hypothetical protein
MMSPLSTITMSDAGIPRPQPERNPAQYRTNEMTAHSCRVRTRLQSSATSNRPLVMSEKAG